MTSLKDLQARFQAGIVGGDDAVLSQLLASLISNNFQVIAFQEETGDLEDVFLQVTKGIVN